MLDDQTKVADQTIHYDLRLDRRTLNDLQAIAAEHGCGIGGVIRFYVKNGISNAKARAAPARPAPPAN